MPEEVLPHLMVVIAIWVPTGFFAMASMLMKTGDRATDSVINWAFCAMLVISIFASALFLFELAATQ